MKNVKRLLPRSRVEPGDTWDLSGLFASDAAWERAFSKWEKRIARYEGFRGRLAEGAAALAACLKFDLDFDRAAERLQNYAYLKAAEDTAEGKYQRMEGRFLAAASRGGQAASFIRPEILAIPAARMRTFLRAAVLAPYRLLLRRVLRHKPHTLGKKEEKLLAMQSEMRQAAPQVFRQLNDADLKFGAVKDHRGEWIELSHATFSALLHSPQRGVRRAAFHQYYRQYVAHQHALAAALSGAVQCDVYYARARRYRSALEAALFADRVPTAVYDNLIASVHRHLPALHHYYDVRRRKMRLRTIHHYDSYVPILAELQTRHTWQQAAETVLEALAPLGSDYVSVLRAGLLGRWCDRYENRGKHSGAFSAGCYDGGPRILMNFQPDVLDHVFTLAHEAGHAMHSYLSAKHQPFAYYDYSIFVAEVASTFNEQLLGRFLLERAGDDRQRAFLINRQIDAIRGTIFRQTMFAEFEKIAHQTVEAGEPLTLDRFREIYHGLLERYFGPDFSLDAELDLECLRIPHFYRGFYVFKYATGMSAAIALAGRVCGGGHAALDDYLGLLCGGCSKDPLDLLRAAGVDLEQPAAVDAALGTFAPLVEQLDALVR
jgi:oligoendopeptidase F